MTDFPQAVGYLLDSYMYKQAHNILLQSSHQLHPDVDYLLRLLAERRELKLELSFEEERVAHFQKQYQLLLHENESLEEELLANYLVELEAKSKTGDIIDFCRAVSPLFYRILERLILQQVPELYTVVKKGKGTAFDKWQIDALKHHPSPVFQAFYQVNKNQPLLTSDSLVDFVSVLDYSEQIKKDAHTLRQFEKAIRNPLAHLIKPFDETILARDTGFSSKNFLDLLAKLLRQTGVSYNRNPFYFDRANAVVKDLLVTTDMPL